MVIRTGEERAQMDNSPESRMPIDDVRILVVDDDRGILSTMEEYLSVLGYRVTALESGVKALDLVGRSDFDIVITDLKMPRVGGLDILSAVKQHHPETEVVIVTGYGTIESAIEALKLGGYDYVQKPVKLERLKLLVDRIVEKRALQKENSLLKSRLRERFSYDGLVGMSAQMQKIYEIIDKIRMNSPTVLIQGDSGTGKEVLARVIHGRSDRRDNPFIPVNCGALSEGVLESELFGHVKGAFTGAVKDKIGLFEAANGGTIFLDEIAEISPVLQVKLLRVLQERTVRPVGDTSEIKVDPRVIAATNRNLEEAVRNGSLRKDLFYRLNVVSIKMPRLTERKEDIPLLISHFIAKFNAKGKKRVTSVSPPCMEMMLNYRWPGNVRELENAIERAFALGADGVIKTHDLPEEIRASEPPPHIGDTVLDIRENEILLIRKALHATGGNKAEAAELLGINLTTLYRKVKKYGMSFR